MPEVVHLRRAVGRNARERLHELAAGQCCRQNLDDGCIAVALVAAHLVAGAATQRRQSRRTVDEHLQDLLRVGDFATVGCDDHAGGCLLARARPVLDLAALHDGGCAVDAEGEFLIGGNRERQRVRAHHVLDAERRGD